MDNNRFVTNSCHIYILTDGCNTKIGITTNLNKRIATYRTHNPNFRLFKTFETNHEEAKKVEQRVKDAFRNDIVGERKEWFSVGPKKVEAVLLVFLERETNNKYQRSLHEIPLNEEAYYLRDIISQIGISTTTRFVIPANIEAAQDRLRQLFAEEANLGKPFNLIPDDVIRLGTLGVDWNHCDPSSDIVRKVVRNGSSVIPHLENSEGFYSLWPLASGSLVAFGTAVVSMPYSYQLNNDSLWREINFNAEKLGWICSSHNEWAWLAPGECQMIVYQPKTSVSELREHWNHSFRKWAVENRKKLLINENCNPVFDKVLCDLAGDNTFPLTITSWYDLFETYLDRYWGSLMPERHKDAYRILIDRWLDARVDTV